MRRLHNIIFLFALLTIALLSAQFYPNPALALAPLWSHWGTPLQVNDGQPATATNPAVAVQGNTAYVAWIDDRAGADIYFAYSNGGSWTPGQQAVTVNYTGNGTLGKPTIVVDPANSNRLYAAWSSDEGSNDYDVHLSRSEDGGLTWPFDIVVTSPDNVINKLVIDPSGRLYLFHEVYTGTNNNAVRVSRSTDQGQSWSVLSTEVITFGTGDGCDLFWEAAIGSNGDLYLLAGGVCYPPFIYKSTNGGLNWSQGGDIPGDDNAASVALAVGAANQVYVVWENEPWVGPTSLRFAASSDSGNSWGVATILANDFASNPDIAVRGNGQLVIGWQDSVPGDEIYLYLVESDDNGQSWNSESLGLMRWGLALAADPNTGTTVALWEGDASDEILATFTFRKVGVELLDPNGLAVTQLLTNTEGWPTQNPLTVQVTLSCPPGGSDCVHPLELTIDSAANARFYVFAREEPNKPVGESDLYCTETSTGTEFSYNSFATNCPGREFGGGYIPFPVLAGETMTVKWSIWIQPSEAADLEITADWGADSDTKNLQVPDASIHPLVIIPGYVATWPPAHGGDLDPLQHSYDNLVEALQLIGYELGEAGSGATLIPFGWDWRAPLGNTGREVLEGDIALIQAPANQTKSYVDYSQVDIIAHSAGGLVARAFIEDTDNTPNNQDKVNQLITLGTPHRGVPAAYRGARGGQYDALFPGSSQIATGVVAGLIACKEGFLAGIDAIQPGGRAEQIVLSEENLYEFLKNNVSSANDLLPTSDVSPVYIVDNANPSVNYPYGSSPGIPPANPFLEDMQTIGGDYDVSKLLVPDIISMFSSNHPEASEGAYKVGTPPYGQGDNIIWGHGEFIPPEVDEIGDGLIPAYSADVTNISALNGASNTTAFDAVNIHHVHLPADSSMVRRLISYVTGVDVVNNALLWNKMVPQPWIPIAIYELVTCSPIRTLVTDPLGRQAGLDPVTGAIINEIPDAIVTKNGDDPHLIMIPRIQGQYHIQAVGIDNGDYTLGAFEIFSGTNEFTGRIITGTITSGESLLASFDNSVFQEENGQVVLEAEHINWQIGSNNQTWITRTTQVGYVGAGYLDTIPDIDQIYTAALTTTSPQLEYMINFTTPGTYYAWLRGHAPNGAGDSVYVSLNTQSSTILTGLPPRQWAWTNTTGQEQRLTVDVTEPGAHTLYLWQREDGLKLDRLVLTLDDSYLPQGTGPNESPRIGN